MTCIYISRPRRDVVTTTGIFHHVKRDRDQGCQSLGIIVQNFSIRNYKIEKYSKM